MSLSPSPDLRARILTEARRAPSPTIADRRKRLMGAASVAAIASLLLLLRLGLATTRASGALLALAVGCGGPAAVAMWLATSRGRKMIGRPRGVLAALVVLAPLGLLAWTGAVAAFEHPLELAGGGAKDHLVCAALTLAFAFGPFVVLAYARRGTDPVHPRLLGAALGAASGAWGGSMIDLHCKQTALAHVALGHALPALLLAAIGALVGARVLGLGREPVEHARKRDGLPHVR